MGRDVSHRIFWKSDEGFLSGPNFGNMILQGTLPQISSLELPLWNGATHIPLNLKFYVGGFGRLMFVCVNP